MVSVAKPTIHICFFMPLFFELHNSTNFQRREKRNFYGRVNYFSKWSNLYLDGETEHASLNFFEK